MSKDSIDEGPVNGRGNASDSSINKEYQAAIAARAIDAEAALPKGTLDPVYEAKAKVLNAAVRASR